MVRGLRDCAIYVAKTKALISCVRTATVQLICVFTYVNSRFSHEAANLSFHIQFLSPKVKI